MRLVTMLCLPAEESVENVGAQKWCPKMVTTKSVAPCVLIVSAMHPLSTMAPHTQCAVSNVPDSYIRMENLAPSANNQLKLL